MATPEPIRLSEAFEAPVDELVRVVRLNGLAGVLARRRASSDRSGESLTERRKGQSE